MQKKSLTIRTSGHPSRTATLGSGQFGWRTVTSNYKSPDNESRNRIELRVSRQEAGSNVHLHLASFLLPSLTLAGSIEKKKISCSVMMGDTARKWCIVSNPERMDRRDREPCAPPAGKWDQRLWPWKLIPWGGNT
jgi:hypothetical protein